MSQTLRRQRRPRERELKALLEGRRREVLGMHDRIVDIAVVAMNSAILRGIDHALFRLNQGTYGDCVACGGQISNTRLRALPFALRCTACEELRERARRPVATTLRAAFEHPIGLAD